VRRRVPNILDAVSRVEMKVDEAEAELEIEDQIRQTLGPTFQHERPIELENDAEVDRRIEQSRRESAKDS
jgi:hypothetical protein